MLKYFLSCFFVASALGAQEFRQIQQIKASGSTKVTLLLYQSADDAIVEFRVTNQDDILYGVEISTDLENMAADVSLPFHGLIPAKSNGEAPLFRITRIDATKSFYFRNLRWQLRAGVAQGQSNKPVVHDGVYLYPWPKGRTFTVDNGFNGYGAHKNEWAYAVDFKMPEGTPVMAAREGTVTAVESKFSKGGNDPSLGDKANYVYILHPDGSTGRYLHFKKKGVLVKIGAKVRAGQKIGLSGNVGWSTDPHLHFDIVIPDTQHGMKTIPFKFKDPKGKVFEPKQGMQLSH